MARRYVKAYFDWVEQTSALSDAEKGRLFTAILEYARSGREPENSGREGLVFPTFKATIDREIEISAIRSENGAKGGRPLKASESKNKQTKANESKRKQTEANESKSVLTQDTRHRTQDTITQDIITQDKSARTRDADAFAAFAAGDGDLLAVLKDFEKMRRSIKKPMADRAKQLLVTKLKNEFPPEQWKSVLEQSIVKCWQDVYPLKEREQQRLGVEQHRENVSSDELESLKAIYAKVKGETT